MLFSSVNLLSSAVFQLLSFVSQSGKNLILDQKKLSPREQKKENPRKEKEKEIANQDDRSLFFFRGIYKNFQSNKGVQRWETLDTEDIAQALEMSRGTNDFYYLTASSRDYGFTEGSRETEKISLAATGRSIVYARSLDEEISGYKQAFLNIPLFKKVYEHYDKRPLPKFDYLRNTLVAEFELDDEFHQSFYDVYQDNIQFLSKLSGANLDEKKQEKASIIKEHSNDAVILGT